MYENKKTFESILVLIVDLCSLIFSMGIAFWIRYGIFYGRFEHGDQIWLLLFAIALYGLIFVLMDFSHQRLLIRSILIHLVNKNKCRHFIS